MYSYYNNFKIRSLATAMQFCNTNGTVSVKNPVALDGSWDIEDVKNPNYYYSIRKKRGEKMMMGHTRYGKDPIMADPIFLEEATPKMVYAARASINKAFFDRE